MTKLLDNDAPDALTQRTIDDFGEQWTTYTDNEGHYASVDYFFDIVMPLLTPDEVKDATVIDVGSGSGRIVLMLLAAGAAKVHAIEPSAAFTVLQANTASHTDRVTCHNLRGDQMPADIGADIAISLGVVHHIPEPASTVAAMHAALKPGGKCVLWLYGHEGNELYLAIFDPLRAVTKRLPHPLLKGVCQLLTLGASGYGAVAQKAPLPLHGYFREVFNKMDWRARYLIAYDQLNPAYAKYYRKDEARRLLEDAGFTDVQLHHRHGYSWLVSGIRPAA
jgi:SAM-dependent methyltransferase